MKKDIEWLKGRINAFQEGENMFTAEFNAGVQDALEYVQELIDQLDEPEVLSDKWIDDNSVYASSDGVTEEYVHVDDLQNLLVPKEEKITEEHGMSESEWAEVINRYKWHLKQEGYVVIEKPIIPKYVADAIEVTKIAQLNYYDMLKALEKEAVQDRTRSWVFNRNLGTFAKAWLCGYEVEEQKYYIVKSEGLDGVHYYFTKFNDEMNGLFTLPNDTKGAYRFDDKEKAQAIANYTNGKVEELEE